MGAPVLSRYDTVIIGAGPAGIMAAWKASRRGDVLLVDASELPRHKSCGGMLNQASRDYLKPFGTLPDEVTLSPGTVRFRFVDWDRAIRRETSLEFLNVDRVAFDEWLLRVAVPPGVEVVDSCVLETFAELHDNVVVTLETSNGPQTVSCDNLIGADGARSAVRRALGVGSAASYVTLQDHVRLEGDIPPYFDCIYMRGIGDDHAYSYVVQKGGHALVGSVFYPKAVRPWEKQDLVLAKLRAAMPQLGVSEKREAAAALYVRRREDLVEGRGRVLLAGEAAGFMSPTSGEGISTALGSGLLAGEAVAAHSPEEALAAYRRAMDGTARDLRRRMRWLPIVESRTGKYFAGLMPLALVDKITHRL